MVCLCMDISCNSIPFLYSLYMDQDALSACTLSGLKGGSPFLCNTVTKRSRIKNWLELSKNFCISIWIYLLKATNDLKQYFWKIWYKEIAKTWQFDPLLYSKRARRRKSLPMQHCTFTSICKIWHISDGFLNFLRWISDRYLHLTVFW